MVFNSGLASSATSLPASIFRSISSHSRVQAALPSTIAVRAG